ncbi:MAG: hypothetical protein ACRDGI_08105 [Candidatus Limnocylindrales bacterium]
MDPSFAYNLALFAHIVGVVAFFATLTLEGIGLRGIRTATNADEARTWLGLMRPLRTFGIGSLLLILLPGLYLAATIETGGGWIAAGLVGFVLIGLFGAVLTGRRMLVVGPTLGRSAGELSPEVRRIARDPALLASYCVRIALALGIVWLMTIKPDFVPSLAVLAVAIAVGAGASRIVGTRRPSETIGAAPQAAKREPR